MAARARLVPQAQPTVDRGPCASMESEGKDLDRLWVAVHINDYVVEVGRGREGVPERRRKNLWE